MSKRRRSRKQQRKSNQVEPGMHVTATGGDLGDAIDGAQNGFGHLWLLLLATPLYYTVLFICAKIGRITQKGLADLLREHYGRPVADLAALLLIISNVALIAADLAAFSQ